MYELSKAVQTASRYKKLNDSLDGLEQSRKTFTRLMDKATEQKLRASRQIESLRVIIKDQEQGRYELVPGATTGTQRLKARGFERQLNDLRGKLTYFLRKEATAREEESYCKARIEEINRNIEVLYDRTP